MNLIGKKVTHKKYGSGTITKIKDNSVFIKFDLVEYGIKQFGYPDSFDKFIFLEDREATNYIHNEINQINNKKQTASAKRENEKRITLNSYRRDSKSPIQSAEVKKTQIPKFDNLDDFCDYYVKKLQSEIMRIKNIGGKRTVIMDGHFLEIVNGKYYYEFETDTELNYPNETPISIWEGEESYDGVIESIFEFTVVISTGHDFGHDRDDEIPSLEFSAEQWRLFKSLCEKVSSLRLSNSSIVKTLVEGGHKSVQPGKSIRTGQNTALIMASSQPITFIWGPPGTGKTQTLAKISEQFIMLGKKVLMLSYSNVSVDGAVERLYKSLEKDIKPGTILRFGYPKNEFIKNHECLTSYNYVIRNNSELLKRRDELRRELNRIRNDKNQTVRRIEIEKELKKIRKQLSEFEKSVVKDAFFVATTVTKAVIDASINGIRFDAVIFDEASMSYVPQIMFGASLATDNFICMGDFCQLPPIVQGEYSKELSVDIFDYCGITEAVRRKFGHEWLCMLDTQYRMHSKIAEFPSEMMYSGLLKTADGIDEKRAEINESIPQIRDACGLMDISGMLSVCSRTHDSSRVNILSALITFSLALQSYNEGFEVGVITPYSAQSRLLHCMAIDQRERYSENSGIVSATVHQFQGSERDVILYDAVECYRSQYPSKLISSMTDNYANRLFNVAMTRARGKFVAVANIKYLLDKKLSENLLFGQLIRRINSCNRMTGDNLKDIIIDKTSCISLYETNDVKSVFFSDIIKAQKSIIIDITDSPKNDNQFFEKLVESLEEAKKTGVKVVIRAENKQNLPNKIRKMAIENKNVMNPIVIIDKKVLWYGIPESLSNFIAEGHVISTLYRPIFRFEGRRTARAVYTMLDMNRTTDETKLLVNGEINSLSDFILANKKCVNCGKPMMLKKSHKRKFFLSCTGYPGCESTEVLSDELVNQYLYSPDGKSLKHCNICGSSIDATISRYGLYIRCCGLNKHKFKPDEI